MIARGAYLSELERLGRARLTLGTFRRCSASDYSN